MVASAKKGITAIEADEADLVLHIPSGFERALRREGTASVHLNINAINGVKAGLASSYAQTIILDLHQEIMPVVELPAGLSSTFRYWYNPDMDYYTFMVPGILVLLVTLVGMFLSGLNIVKEKEIGTIEQINVSPIRKHQFIIGKLLPFWIIAQVELALGLTVGWLVFDIPIVGSLGVVFAFSSIYLLVVLGIGLLVSTFTDTQQQAMFISWFFLVIFILMSGLFTPIESMPGWAQQITRLNPVTYFVDVVRLVLLKGSSWWDIRSQWIALSIFAVVINGAAVLNYRKTD
jgi:ABC-2 type transport system permease protein